MRSLFVALVVALLFAAAAEAKLNPAFSVRVAEPGDTVELDVGPGTEQFLGELRIFLVSLEGDDRPQVKIGELGTPGQFGPPRVLRFEVPDVSAGEYTVAIWARGYRTGTWANALEGINPLLTVGGADEGAAFGQGSSQGSSVLRVAGVVVGGLALGLVALGWRRRQAVSGQSRDVGLSQRSGMSLEPGREGAPIRGSRTSRSKGPAPPLDSTHCRRILDDMGLRH